MGYFPGNINRIHRTIKLADMMIGTPCIGIQIARYSTKCYNITAPCRNKHGNSPATGISNQFQIFSP